MSITLSNKIIMKAASANFFRDLKVHLMNLSISIHPSTFQKFSFVTTLNLLLTFSPCLSIGLRLVIFWEVGL